MRRLLTCGLILGCLVARPASADSFLPPTLQVVESPSQTIRATIIPTPLSCAPAEIDCKPAARAVIERKEGFHASALGTLVLLNPVAPGQALVSDDGERLLTIDDYGGIGFGPNVIVVYRRDGSVVRRMSLGDILPAAYIDGLPRTAASLGWSGYHAIRPGTHIADIGIHLVDAGNTFDRSRQLKLALDLDSGAIAAPAGAAWERALICARANGWSVPTKAALRQREAFVRRCRAAR